MSLFLLAVSRKSICVQSVGLYNTLYCASYNVTVSVGQKQKARLPSKCWFIIWYIIYQLQCHCFCWQTAGSPFAFKVLVYYIIHYIPTTISLFFCWPTTGSPFAFKVSAQPDASKVRVSGPGVEHGILATFQSRFVVETRGAGAGQLTVRIRGPKGWCLWENI